MNQQSPTIVLRDICKSFRRGRQATQVLRDVSLEVAAGECVFLVGPSGSGKTTLLSIIGALLSADEGQLTVLGRELNEMTSLEKASFRREKLGFMFQRFHLIRGLSAEENVLVPLVLDGMAEPVARGKARHMLDQVGLADQSASDPRQMSVGQCQRVALARALITDPQIILADEPTASLDIGLGESMMDLICRLTRDVGRTAVVVTHDSRIFSYADRIVRLEDGRVRQETSAQDLGLAEPSELVPTLYLS